MHPAAIGLVFVVGALVVYFAVGTLVRYRSGLRHFPEVLPNYTLWRRIGHAIRNGFLFVVSCGRYTSSSSMTANDIGVLPSKPRRDMGFEELPPDEFDEFDDEAAMQPAPVVVVRY